MPEMFTSGGQITGNPGNAALGYSGTGIDYAANPADTNPFGTIQSTIANLQQQDEVRRTAARARAYKEQDELAQYLSGTGNSVFNMPGPDGKKGGFNMLQEDREEVNRAADDLRKQIMANPRTWKFDPKIKEKQAQLEQLKNHAGIRAVHVAQNEVLAAQTNDPVERARIMQNVGNTKKQGVSTFAAPEPYMPDYTWKPETFMPKNTLTNKNAWEDIQVGVETDKDGNEIVVTSPALKQQFIDIRKNLTKGSNEFREAANMISSLYADPSSRDPNVVSDINKKIAQFNERNGFKEGDPGYVDKFGEVFPDRVELRPLKNKDGSFNEQTVKDVMYGLMVEHYGQAGTEKKVKRTASQLKKEQHDIKKDEGAAKRAQSELDLKWAKFNADKNKLSKEEQKSQKEELESRTLANTVYNILSAAPTKTFDEVAKKVTQADLGGLFQTMSDYGVDVSNAQIAPLNVSDVTVRNMLGGQKYDDKGKLINAVSTPKYAYKVTTPDGQIKLVSAVPAYRDVIKDGEVQMDRILKKPKREQYVEWSVMSPEEALAALPKKRNNFKTVTEPTQRRIDRATEYLEELMGAPVKPKPTVAPKVSEEEPAKRPASIPSTAVQKTYKGQQVWVDNATRKVYDSDGNEITPQ